MTETQERNPNKLSMADSGFWSSWAAKVAFTLISVKAWGLLVSISVSTALLLHGFIDGPGWVTYNTTIWALIFGIRGIFAVQEQREDAARKNRGKEIEAQLQTLSIKYAALSKATSVASTRQPVARSDGKLVVGDEPDR